MLIDVAEWRQDILEEHLEELEALWNRRLGMPRSADMDAVGLRRCDARIEAHTDALALAGEVVLPQLVAALASGEAPLVASAAMVMASSNQLDLERRVVDKFWVSDVETRVGLREALQCRCPSRLCAALGNLATAEAPTAASAWMVITGHGEKVAADQRRRWVSDKSPEVRKLVWQVEARSAASPGRDRSDGFSQADYGRAFEDTDPGVRRAALEAAARTAQPWLLDRLRSKVLAASAQDMHEAMFLAALGGPGDIPLLLTVGGDQKLGWSRFNILALCGRAPAVEALLAVMQKGPPVETALAGVAFFRITGIDVQLPERIPLVPEGTPPDELSDEIKACDPERAARGWETIKSSMGQSRWVRGVDVATLVPEGLPHTLDLETRWSLQLRAAFEHPAVGVVFDGERFPFA